MSEQTDTRHLLSLAVAAALCSLLAACGGGGGGAGGMVHSAPPPPPTPPPAPEPTEPCPAPITSDCVVTHMATMTGGRNSQFALHVQLAPDFYLELGDPAAPGDRYVFAGGTTVAGGLDVWYDNTLVSDVEVFEFGAVGVYGSVEGDILVHGPIAATGGFLYLDPSGVVEGNLDNAGDARLHGQLLGNVANTGELRLTGRVVGNVDNAGRILVDGTTNPRDPAFRTIDGSFSQAPGGTFAFMLAPDHPAFEASPLQVTGQAHLAGTLELGLYTDDWGPYPGPATGAHHIIHADGGVFGQFTQWTSPGLFLEGAPRYDSHDVWFDLARISLEGVMAGNAADPLTLASAANLDRAFDIVDGYAVAAPETLGEAQRRLLSSAGAVLDIDRLDQATHTLDSLSGRSFADARTGLLDGFAGFGPTQQQLRAWRNAPAASQAWSAPVMASGASGSGMSESGAMGGFTHRLGPQLLVGAATGTGDAWLAFDRGGGQAHARQAIGTLYAHAWRGPWHAHGEVRGSRGRVDTSRRIDLGDRRAHQAVAGFDASQLHARLEGGFDQALGGGRLTPFAGLRYDAVRTGAFAETGDTGFELLGRAAGSRRTSAELGLRYQRQWPWRDGWLRLEATGARRHALQAGGTALAAAFAGAADAVFLVDDATVEDASWLHLRLAAGRGAAWSGTLHYGWRADATAIDRSWWLGFERRL